MEEYLQQNQRPETIPWKVSDIVKAALVAIGITVAIGIAMGIVMLLLIGTTALQDIASQNLNSTETLQAIVDNLEANGRLNIMLITLFIFMVLGEGAIPLGTWLFRIRKYRCKWDALGFRRFDIKKGLLLALIVTALGVGISIGYEELLEQLKWGTSSDSFYTTVTPNNFGIALFAITAAVAAPLAEETFFRGFLLQGLGKRLKFGWAAIISAAIFAIGHFSPSGLVPIFILGLMLAWLFNKTKSIWPCIIVHFAYNSIALIFMIIS